MKIIWLTFVFEIVFLSFFVNDTSNTIPILLILIHSLLTMTILISKKKNHIIFLIAYFSRLGSMFWDLFARDIYILPNSGADTENFYQQSLFFSENTKNLFSYDGELYSKIIGVIFSFIGPQRIIGQYINVLIGLSIVSILYKIFKELEISEGTSKCVLLIAAILPNSLIMSSIFLREIFPTYFVAASFYFFIKWIKEPVYINMTLSFVFLGIASTFHSGLVGMSLGYVFAYLFYYRRDNKFYFNSKTITSFVLIFILSILTLTIFKDSIFQKFQNVSNLEDIYQKASRTAEGGSAYLQNIDITNPIQLLIFSPIRSLYFISSPLPMNWRGFMDVFTFMTDSILYLGTLISFIKKRKNFGNYYPIMISTFLMILGTVSIFGMGVSNAGTAVRHRQKIVPIFLVLLALLMDSKKRENSVINIKKGQSEKDG